MPGSCDRRHVGGNFVHCFYIVPAIGPAFQPGGALAQQIDPGLDGTSGRREINRGKEKHRKYVLRQPGDKNRNRHLQCHFDWIMYLGVRGPVPSSQGRRIHSLCSDAGIDSGDQYSGCVNEQGEARIARYLP